jgi:hypothetical protein
VCRFRQGGLVQGSLFDFAFCFTVVIPSDVEGSAFSFAVALRRHSERSEESLLAFVVAGEFAFAVSFV